MARVTKAEKSLVDAMRNVKWNKGRGILHANK